MENESTSYFSSDRKNELMALLAYQTQKKLYCQFETPNDIDLTQEELGIIHCLCHWARVRKVCREMGIHIGETCPSCFTVEGMVLGCKPEYSVTIKHTDKKEK